MGLGISFELSDEDLHLLGKRMEESMTSATSASAEDILAGAHQVLSASEQLPMPEFMRERQQVLQRLVDMVEDTSWNLPNVERLRVISALAYFVLAEDLIPDDIPGLGFLDDAIMIELVARELKHELEAYLDFCQFRDQQQAEQGDPEVSRSSWLAKKRETLMSRMEKRRKAGGLGWLKLR